MIELKERIRQLGICIIIPTYNNEITIGKIVDECKKWSDDVIVVNDGSTDSTSSILSSYKANGVTVIDYRINKGKGYALKTAFKYALAKQYVYAITIDADGQHFASDIPAFVHAVEKFPNTLIVGSRNLNAEGMPLENTFANKFSNFWFSVQTLQCIPDTQTGFRLYPLQRMGRMWWLTSKYEAELEMLVFAAWHGIKLTPIPINVFYPPIEERVSHFRPIADFVRISVLNTFLCFGAVLYGIPKLLLYKVLNKQLLL